jgi:polysaccharide export outer membrane protein
MRTVASRLGALAAALLFMLVSAAVPAASQTVAQPSAPLTMNAGYVLGPGDVVETAVLGRDDFKQRVQVQVDGTIQLPYLRSVKAADLTVIQLRDEITQLLRQGGFFIDPVVSVSVASFASRYVTVLGEFGSPGLVPVDRAYRVSEILARAGGAKSSAGDTLVLRRTSGQQFVLPLASVSSGGPDEDPLVQPGDKLFIATAPNFYIYGQVTGPGSYKVERGMTVRMALARGGGLTDRGSLGRISVIRHGQKLRANLDMPITGDDTIVVGERFF